jgi:hypothetical protein
MLSRLCLFALAWLFAGATHGRSPAKRDICGCPSTCLDDECTLVLTLASSEQQMPHQGMNMEEDQIIISYGDMGLKVPQFLVDVLPLSTSSNMTLGSHSSEESSTEDPMRGFFSLS